MLRFSMVAWTIVYIYILVWTHAICRSSTKPPSRTSLDQSRFMSLMQLCFRSHECCNLVLYWIMHIRIHVRMQIKYEICIYLYYIYIYYILFFTGATHIDMLIPHTAYALLSAHTQMPCCTQDTQNTANSSKPGFCGSWAPSIVLCGLETPKHMESFAPPGL